MGSAPGGGGANPMPFAHRRFFAGGHCSGLPSPFDYPLVPDGEKGFLREVGWLRTRENESWNGLACAARLCQQHSRRKKEGQGGMKGVREKPEKLSVISTQYSVLSLQTPFLSHDTRRRAPWYAEAQQASTLTHTHQSSKRQAKATTHTHTPFLSFIVSRTHIAYPPAVIAGCSPAGATGMQLPPHGLFRGA